MSIDAYFYLSHDISEQRASCASVHNDGSLSQPQAGTALRSLETKVQRRVARTTGPGREGYLPFEVSLETLCLAILLFAATNVDDLLALVGFLADQSFRPEEVAKCLEKLLTRARQ